MTISVGDAGHHKVIYLHMYQIKVSPGIVHYSTKCKKKSVIT